MAASAVFGVSTSSITDALGKINPNERRLLMILALIVLGLAPLKAFDMRSQAAADNEEAHAALTDVRANARRTTGSGLAAKVAETREDVRGWSWAATTAPVGQVMIQDDIADMATKGGLAAAEVRTAEKIERAGMVSLIQVEVIAPFTWPGLSGFLRELAASDKGFVLDSVTMTEDKEPKARITLRLPLVVGEAAAE